MLTLIAYDLKSPDKDYKPLYDAIKGLGDKWWHYMDSLWLVHTNLSPDECSHRLQEEIDKSDHLLVVDITNQHRQGWLPSKAWEWIKSNNN